MGLSKERYGIFWGIRYSDFLFLWVLFANLLLVAYLGVSDHQKALKLAYSQTSGEQIISWFEGFNLKLQENESVEPKSCVPIQEPVAGSIGDKPNTWNDCIKSLFSMEGPFHEYTNLLMPQDSPYASKCDKHELGTSGAFIFEKMIMNPAGPPTVSPMEANEKLVSGMNIRLSLCDTGYYLIKIGEFKI